MKAATTKARWPALFRSAEPPEKLTWKNSGRLLQQRARMLQKPSSVANIEKWRQLRTAETPRANANLNFERREHRLIYAAASSGDSLKISISTSICRIGMACQNINHLFIVILMKYCSLTLYWEYWDMDSIYYNWGHSLTLKFQYN